MRSFLLLVCVLFWTGCSDSTSKIDLRGTWKIQFSDNQDFSSTEYDDQSWQSISVPASWTSIKKGFTDVAWYRYTFQIPQGYSKQDRVLKFTGVDVDETYLNGQKIGASGSFSDPESHAYSRARLYPLAPEILKDGSNTIAIRIKGLFPQNSGLSEGRAEIGNLHELERERATAEIRQICFSAVYLTVALYFFLFFVRLPSMRPHLYFAIFCLSIAVYYICRTILIQDWIGFLNVKRFEYIVLFTLPISGLAFICSHFDIRQKWYVILYYLGLVSFIYFPLSTNSIAVWNRFLGFWELLMIPGLLLAIGFLIRESLRSNREAQVLLGGILIYSATVVNDILNDRRIFNTPLLASYGFLAFVVSMSASLVRSFVELQRKSEQTVQRLLEVDKLKERLLSNITELLLLPAASILAVANRLTSSHSEAALLPQYQELQQHGNSLNEALDGVLLMSRIQSGVESASFRVINAQDLKSIYPGGNWEDKASISGTESLLRGLFAMPGLGGFSWNGATGLSLTIRAWSESDNAGPLRENLLREIVNTLSGQLLRRPDGSWLVRIPSHSPDLPWTPGRAGIGSTRAVLVRSVMAMLVAGTFGFLGEFTFMSAIGGILLFAVFLFLMDWRFGSGNGIISRVIQSKSVAYVRTLSDIVASTIAFYATGGIDSPYLIGMALPCMLSSYGHDPWRGRFAAIASTLAITGAEIGVSLGILVDMNVLAGTPTRHSPLVVALMSPAILITLFIVSETTNRLYRKLSQTRQESDGRKRYAHKLSEFSTVANATTDLGHLMEQIVAYLQSAFQIDTLILLLPDAVTGELVAARTFTSATAGLDIARKAEKLRVSVGPSGGIVRATYERKKPLYVKVARNPQLAQNDSVSLEDFQVPWFLLVPLVVQSRSIGLILCTSSEKDSLEKSDVSDVEAFCGQMAGAVYTSNILQNLNFEKERAEDLRNLAEIAHQHAEQAQQQSELIRELAETSAAEAALLAELSRNALQGLGLQEVLTAVVDTLRKRFGSDSATLYLTNPDSTYLNLTAVMVNRESVEVNQYPDMVRNIPLVPESGTMYRTFSRQKAFYTNRMVDKWLADSPVDSAVIRSWTIHWIVEVPLIVHQKVVGLLAFTGQEGKGPRKSEMEFVIRVASQVAGAVQQVKLLDAALQSRKEADSARRRAEKLNEFAKALNASQDFSNVIEQIVAFVQSEYRIDSCILLLPDANNREISTTRSFTLKDVDPEMVAYANRLKIPLGDNAGVIAAAYQRGKTFYVSLRNRDIFRKPYPGMELDRGIVEFLKFPWFLILPLLIQGSPVGMLLMTSYSNDAGLTSGVIRELESFGDQIAGAIHSMSLLSRIKQERDGAETARLEAERGRRHTEKLNEISKGLNASPDFQGLIGQIISFMQQEYSIDSSILLLPEKETGDLVTAQHFINTTADPEVQSYARTLRIKPAGEGGMLGLTYQRKKPLYIEINGPRDIFKRPYAGMEADREMVRRLHLGWFLLLPMVVQNQSIGLLMVTSYTRPDGLRRKEIQELEQFSEQIAGALNSSNLLDRIQKERDGAEKAREEIQRLSELIKGLNENLDLHDILRKVAEFIRTNFNIKYHFLFLKDAQSDYLRFFSGSYPSEISDEELLKIQNTLIPIDGSEQGVHYLACKNKRSLFFPALRAQSPSAIETRNQQIMKMKSLLVVPLVVNGEVIGTLDFSHGSQKMELSKADQKRISTFAEFVAGAIKGSTLFHQIEAEQQRSELARKETETLANLARRANEGRDLDNIMAVLAEVLAERFKGTTVFLALPTNHDTLELKSFFLNCVKQPADQVPVKEIPLNESGGTIYRTYSRKKMLYLSRIAPSWNARSEVDRKISEQWDLKWFVQVPLLVEDRVVGIFGFSGPESVHLSREDLNFVERIAAQISGAVNAVELLIETREAQTVAELERSKTAEALSISDQLASISKLVNQTHDLHEVAKLAFGFMRETYKFNTMALLLLDESKEHLHIDEYEMDAVMPDIQQWAKNVRVPLKEEASATLYRTFKQQKLTYLRKIPDDDASPVDNEFRHMLKLKTFLDVPLIVSGESVGVLFGSRPEDAAPLTRKNLQHIQAFANQIAGAVRTSQLFTETEKAREESDRLLQNVLPASVAKELKQKGQVEPLFYDSVSVLFTDFVGFTQASENMLPDELVAELDGCFSQFDEVVKRNNMEKLKTIGDAYMCAAGLPTISDSHAIDACLTGLEFREFLMTTEEIKKSLGMSYWQIRIGIHSGPVTAGVIGTNKFAYDIWGDTVNTASRMESSGTPGKVNISGETYSLVKDFFDCEYRGKIKAKGKGEVDMYYLLRIKPELSADETGLLPNAKFEMMRASASMV